MSVTLNDLVGHSPVAGLFKCNPSNICAVFYQISTDSAVPQRQLGFLSSSVKLHYYGRRIIVTPFVNQQFSLQVVEGCRAVQFVEQFTSGEDVSPAGRHSAHRRSDTMPTARHRRSSSPGNPRASVASLLYAHGHLFHGRTRQSYLYNVRLPWYNVVLSC